MPSLENIRAARAATDRASAEFRALCVAALDDHPLRQVAIAANVSRDTLYAWKLQASQNVASEIGDDGLTDRERSEASERWVSGPAARHRPVKPTDTEETQP